MSAARKFNDVPGQDTLPFFSLVDVRIPEGKRVKHAEVLPLIEDGLPTDFQVPEHGLDGDAFLRREDGSFVMDKVGKKIKRWGTTIQARKLLGISDKETLYVLIHAGIIRAFKLNTVAKSKNGRFRVDLQSVMSHKLRQLGRSG